MDIIDLRSSSKLSGQSTELGLEEEIEILDKDMIRKGTWKCLEQR